MHIYYYYPLYFSCTSAMTIQVMQDYGALSHPWKLFFFGSYEREEELEEIRSKLAQGVGRENLHLWLHKGGGKWNIHFLRWRMALAILKDRAAKVIISRNYNKMAEAVHLRPFIRRGNYLLERHEDAIPHLFKEGKRREKEKNKFQRLLAKLDGMVLTAPTHLSLFKSEFSELPPMAMLPNGVHPAAFTFATRGSMDGDIILTYAGQFTAWKNIDLLFQALALLPNRYRLRIAGGKGDFSSFEKIQRLAQRYSLEKRVDFLGFVRREDLCEKVYQGSHLLLLPLGDNLYSKQFTSPMKLFEYMATKIPVVAVDYPTVREITGGESVYLSSPEPQAFAETIQRAMVDPHVAERIALMGKIVAEYSYEKRGIRYDHFLRSLINS